MYVYVYYSRNFLKQRAQIERDYSQVCQTIPVTLYNIQYMYVQFSYDMYTMYSGTSF